MDLLEFTNVMSTGARDVKKVAVGAGHGTHADCICGQIAGQIHVYRAQERGVPVAGISADWTGVRVALMFAATGFNADTVAITLDDESALRKRRELVVITLNKAGEIMWKLSPYEIVGHEVYFGAEEVPDAFPIRNSPGDTTGDGPKADILKIMQHECAWPAKEEVAQVNPGYAGTNETYEAHMDVGAARSLIALPAEAGIRGFNVYAQDGTERARILARYLPGDVAAILPASLEATEGGWLK